MTLKKLLSNPIVLTLSSLLCLIHCLLLPIFMPFLPLLGNFFESVYVELSILFFSVALGFFIIYFGYKQHQLKRVVVFFVIGAFFWLLQFLAESMSLFESEIPVILGTLFVMISYLINFNAVQCFHNED